MVELFLFNSQVVTNGYGIEEYMNLVLSERKLFSV